MGDLHPRDVANLDGGHCMIMELQGVWRSKQGPQVVVQGNKVYIDGKKTPSFLLDNVTGDLEDECRPTTPTGTTASSS